MKFFDWLKHKIEPKRTACPGPDNIGVVGETDFLVLTYKRPLSNKQLEAIETSVKQSGIRTVVVCCDEIYIQRNVETRACNPVKPTQPETRTPKHWGTS